MVRRQTAASPRELAVLRWGFVPSWAKDPSIGFKLINARAETAGDKPAFREAINRRRCLIPATGFYEWRREGKTRIPFCFTMLDDSIFALAGIWESWPILQERVPQERLWRPSLSSQLVRTLS